MSASFFPTSTSRPAVLSAALIAVLQDDGGLGSAPIDPSLDAGIESGWFAEKEVMWPGQRMGLKVEALLMSRRSALQHIVVFDSATYGRVLVLDGVIQLTERDEHAYQEMIAHLPLFAHAAPRDVLIVGGGDGGVLREIARHSCVRSITMCEIDVGVIETSKLFFPTTMATAFDDPRLRLITQDAAVWVALPENAASFDVAISDSSDPVGPADVLFQSSFLATISSALRPGGIACLQGECMWLHLPLIATVLADARSVFDAVDYAYTTVPTYPSGQIGFILAAKAGADGAPPAATAMSAPARPVAAELQAQLRYYSAALHAASFVLPAFAVEAVEAAKAAVLVARS